MGGDFYDPKVWLGVAVMGAIGMAIVRILPSLLEPGYQEQLLTQMHLQPLPDGVSIIDSEIRGGRGGERITMVLRFTPAAYAAYRGALSDHQLWSWQPIAFGGIETQRTPPEGTVHWRTGPHAFPGFDNPLNRPWGADADHSLCVAVREVGWGGEPEEVAPCTAFDTRDGHPDLWLKGQLDDEHLQLRAMLTTYP